MGKKPEERPSEEREEEHRRHLQYRQDSWTEIDSEGSDAEMAQGRQSQEPFYTPLVTEAAERRLKKEREERSRAQGEHRSEEKTSRRATKKQGR